MEFEEKFVAFVDVLGFKQLVKAAESGSGMSLPELMDTLSILGVQQDEKRFERSGPTICPESRYVQKNLSFKVTQISDCVIVSTEVSPAGIINLINYCWGSVIKLLMKEILCRGYITKGSIYHQNNQVVGTGYQNAYIKESSVTAFKREADERGTPFVEIDPIVCSYVEKSTDKCVREMFSRMVKTEKNITALFPFQRLCHSFSIGGFGFNDKFNPEKEKNANDNIRNLLRLLKERVMYVDPLNDDAMKKARHYIAALDDQLIVCDKTDESIDMLCSPFPAKRLKDIFPFSTLGKQPKKPR